MGDSMTTKINATTTTGVIVQPDNSGALELQTNNGTTAVTIDTSQNATFAGKVTSAGALTLASNGTTTAVTIDTSQNVGIGTISTNSKLEVLGSVVNTISNAGTEDAATITITNADVSGLGRIAKTLYEIGNLPLASIAGVYTNFNAGGDVGGALAFSTQTNLAGGVVERMRIDSTGNVSITQTPGKYTVDTTGGTTSIANGGTVDYSNASGMLIANNHTNGAVTIYLCGGGSTSVVSNVGTQVGTFAYVAGIGGYRWTNNYGSTANFGFFFVRTRNTA